MSAEQVNTTILLKAVLFATFKHPNSVRPWTSRLNINHELPWRTCWRTLVAAID